MARVSVRASSAAAMACCSCVVEPAGHGSACSCRSAGPAGQFPLACLRDGGELVDPDTSQLDVQAVRLVGLVVADVLGVRKVALGAGQAPLSGHEPLLGLALDALGVGAGPVHVFSLPLGCDGVAGFMFGGALGLLGGSGLLAGGQGDSTTRSCRRRE
ncbi:hypothetical protein JYK22_02005, partial [Nonomuraea sp. RK-328]|nr:hypothetical protein [Nonomuraea sp. RK-328]